MHVREQESKNDDGQRHVSWHVAPAGTVIGLVNATVLGILTNREHFPKRVEPRSSADPMFFLNPSPYTEKFMNTCQEDKQIQSGHLYNGGEFNFSLFQQILKFL